MSNLEIVAEIGSNWYHPYPDEAKAETQRAIVEAADAGATIVKLQIFDSSLYSQERAPRQFDTISKLAFPISWLSTMRSLAHAARVKLWASVFSPRLVDACLPFVQGLKIASGDLVYDELIVKVARVCKRDNLPMAISTGAANYDEIDRALKIIRKIHPPELILFHCVSAYPADPEFINLLGGTLFADRVDALGFSDHTLTSMVGTLAIPLGFTYFEKHFRGSGAIEDSPDFSISMPPKLFRDYVYSLHRAEEILGEKEKKIHSSEMAERKYARRGSDGKRPIDSEKLS